MDPFFALQCSTSPLKPADTASLAESICLQQGKSMIASIGKIRATPLHKQSFATEAIFGTENER